ncbi:MAG: hypothetical protein M1814_000538 [Vezdaea aestivalis]|nr:MAG: hypothetical protein M1814_000538 [Vezdaea aestivalis]
MPVQTLKSLALKLCLQNIRDIEDVGDYSYDEVREILLKLPSPKQLKRIELASPQICENETDANTAELWMSFCRRDILNWDMIWQALPDEERPKLGWKVYSHYEKRYREKLAKDGEEVRAKYAKILEDKKKNQSRLLKPSELPLQKKKRRAPGISAPKPTAPGASAVRKLRQGAKTGIQPRAGPQTGSSNVFGPRVPVLSREELERRRAARAAKDKAQTSKPVTPILLAKNTLRAARPTNQSANSTKATASAPIKSGIKRDRSGVAKADVPKEDISYLDWPRSKRPIKVGRRSSSSSSSSSPATRLAPLKKKEIDDLDNLFSEPEETSERPPAKKGRTEPAKVPSPSASPRSSPVRSTASQSPVKGPVKILRRAPYDPLFRRRIR